MDGHHDGPATVEYFHQIRPYMAPAGVMLFDDIRWSEGMMEAWTEVCAHPSVMGALDFQQSGIVCMGEPEAE